MKSVKRWWQALGTWQKVTATGLPVLVLCLFLWAYLTSNTAPGAAPNGAQVMPSSSPVLHDRTSSDAYPKTETQSGEGFALLQSYAGEHEKLVSHLETRLAGTIAQLAHISQARVHISKPCPTTLVRETDSAKAAVVVWPEAGTQLSSSDIDAVASVACSGVENLLPQSVRIIDASSNVTYRAADDTTGFVPSTIASALRLSQTRYEHKVREVLGPGEEKAVVSVVCRVRGEQKDNSAGTAKEGLPVLPSSNRIVPVSASVSLSRADVQGGAGASPVSEEHLKLKQYQYRGHIARALGISADEVSVLVPAPKQRQDELPRSGRALGICLGLLAALAVTALGAFLLGQSRSKITPLESSETKRGQGNASSLPQAHPGQVLPGQRTLSRFVGIDEITHLEPEQVFERLQDEHPETVASVLSQLPRERCLQVLLQFESTRQKDILPRIVEKWAPSGEAHLAVSGEVKR